MSKIQKLPQKVLDAITPYLLTGEVIDKALLQDNKKPREIWLIKTNQAIILHGQQPDKPQPAIMVLALDELREIDYLQKNDDIQVILYSSKNNGKAVFHFEKTAAKEIEAFFDDLGDLITFRYQTDLGKISVVQKALPIGHKDRKVFGRGKKPDVPFLAKTKVSKPSESPEKPVETLKVKSNPPAETNNSAKINETAKPVSTNKVTEQQIPQKTVVPEIKKETKPIDKPIPSQPVKSAMNTESPKIETNNSVKKAETHQDKSSNTSTKASGITKNSLISHLQENPIPPKEPEDESAKAKETDFGSPVYFITVTIIATIVGFFCLSFFQTISKVVKYFRKH
ncbi:MAG: hypothetical protein J6Z11_02185 [Candidatus Riflebacteria bacterium]|nr:hypothetical protein [Candidatus Riflebacteria bacterium]